MAAEVEVDKSEWKTDDLSLAAYLRYINENDFVGYEWEGRSCFVVFERSREIVQQAVEFMGGEALVDPVRYMAVRATVRDEIKNSRP